MVAVWNQCQEAGAYHLDPTLLSAIIGGPWEHVCAAQLGELEDSGVRIRGTQGRVEWLVSRRVDGRKGGRPKTIGIDGNATVRRVSANPPTPTLTPESSVPSDSSVCIASPDSSQTQNPSKLTRSRRAKRAPANGVAYSPGFLQAWQTYPHNGQRSVKRKAFAVWLRDGLEECPEAVLAWIEDARGSADWRRDSGAFVPGMQVWLNGRDFSDPPRVSKAAAVFPVDFENRLLTPEEKAEEERKYGRLS